MMLSSFIDYPTMPQLDFLTYCSQLVWLLFFFLSFYLITLKFILPPISTTLKLRRKLIGNSRKQYKLFKYLTWIILSLRHDANQYRASRLLPHFSRLNQTGVVLVQVLSFLFNQSKALNLFYFNHRWTLIGLIRQIRDSK